jgi:hypothetical protein
MPFTSIPDLLKSNIMRDVIICVLLIALIYVFLFKKCEPFTASLNQDDAIVNLGMIAKNILDNNDTLTLPAKTLSVDNLVVDGSVTFTNIDSSDNSIMYDILPTYTILAFAPPTTKMIPTGWAICDGSIIMITNNPFTTPDLRGRFLTGMNDKEVVGTLKGNNSVKITESNLPPHRHDYYDRVAIEPLRQWDNDEKYSKPFRNLFEFIDRALYTGNASGKGGDNQRGIAFDWDLHIDEPQSSDIKAWTIGNDWNNTNYNHKNTDSGNGPSKSKFNGRKLWGVPCKTAVTGAGTPIDITPLSYVVVYIIKLPKVVAPPPK